jgi:hypothetical protein
MNSRARQVVDCPPTPVGSRVPPPLTPPRKRLHARPPPHLTPLGSQLRGPVHQLGDHHRWQRANLTAWDERVRVHFLPKYAPETNPVEEVCRHLARFGPPHLRTNRTSANMLRTSRPTRASRSPQRAEDRHADAISGLRLSQAQSVRLQCCFILLTPEQLTPPTRERIRAGIAVMASSMRARDGYRGLRESISGTRVVQLPCRFPGAGRTTFLPACALCPVEARGPSREGQWGEPKVSAVPPSRLRRIAGLRRRQTRPERVSWRVFRKGKLGSSREGRARADRWGAALIRWHSGEHAPCAGVTPRQPRP